MAENTLAVEVPAISYTVETKCPKCKRTLAHRLSVKEDGTAVMTCRHPNCRYAWPYQGTLLTPDPAGPSAPFSPTMPRQVKSQPTPKAPHTYTDLAQQIFDQYIRPRKVDYHERRIQLQLAGHVLAAFEKSRILLGEAGVGTGKSYAYLTPLFYFLHKEKGPKIEQQGPVIISTKTINLIDQMMGKDIPFVQQAFEKRSVFEVDTTPISVMKGQRHYLCFKRLYAAPNNMLGEQRKSFWEWADSSKAGNRAEGVAKALSDAQWDMVNVADCEPESCKHRLKCPFIRERERVRNQRRGIVVTNHNLLAEHLASVQRGRPGLWISPSAVIVDEAHALENSFRQQLSYSLTKSKFRRLFQLLEHIDYDIEYLNEVAVDDLLPLSDQLFVQLYRNRVVDRTIDDGLGRYAVNFDTLLMGTVERLGAIVEDLMAAVDTSISNMGYRSSDHTGEEGKRRSRLRRVRNSAERVAETVDRFLQVVKGTGSSHAAWFELKGGESQLVVAPLDVSYLLRDQLWSKDMPVILTSGTLAGADGFDSIVRSLGLPDSDRVRAFQRVSSFDYPSRVRIYIPQHLPEPKPKIEDGSDDEFSIAVGQEIGRLLSYSGGRALCLFTSYRRLQVAHQYLQTMGFDFPILAQGTGNSGALLDEFRRIPTSVLLATGAFWEGADVEGDSLTLVIMDKLPFPNPNDPLIEAQQRAAREKGEDPRLTVFLPAMITTLRQGAGRLIRNERDWGTIALLDKRAVKRKYQQLVKSALPSAPWLHDPKEIEAWIRVQGPNRAKPMG